MKAFLVGGFKAGAIGAAEPEGIGRQERFAERDELGAGGGGFTNAGGDAFGGGVAVHEDGGDLSDGGFHAAAPFVVEAILAEIWVYRIRRRLPCYYRYMRSRLLNAVLVFVAVIGGAITVQLDLFFENTWINAGFVDLPRGAAYEPLRAIAADHLARRGVALTAPEHGVLGCITYPASQDPTFMVPAGVFLAGTAAGPIGIACLLWLIVRCVDSRRKLLAALVAWLIPGALTAVYLAEHARYLYALFMGDTSPLLLTLFVLAGYVPLALGLFGVLRVGRAPRTGGQGAANSSPARVAA